MTFAIVNGSKAEATPDSGGSCPLCDQILLSKCGELKVWHWAHLRDRNCDNWTEPETEWHKNWKWAFGKEYSEITISKDGVKHRADIQTKDNIIIELQSSPIQVATIRRRENFYGERMLWILNGKDFKKSFEINPGIASKDRVRQDRDYYMQHGHFPNELIDNSTTGVVKDEKKLIPFAWRNSRKCWSEVQRPVFIDFGGDCLLHIIKGMGTRIGFCKQVPKDLFLTKYGGNLDLISTLIDRVS